MQAWRCRAAFDRALGARHGAVEVHGQSGGPEVRPAVERQLIDDSTRLGDDISDSALAKARLAVAHSGRWLIPARARRGDRGDRTAVAQLAEAEQGMNHHTGTTC